MFRPSNQPALRALSPDASALAGIGAWFALCSAAIGPFAEVPIIDDWTYAFSVEHWLRTGRLDVLPISAVYPITQIVWGTLFSLPFGFSFTALRVSTVVMAMLGAWALYLTLRELGVRVQHAALGTLCIAANPVSILLSHSFMTDVPFVSVSSAAALAYVRGLQRRQSGWSWLAGLLAVGAVLIRQVAMVLPLAAALALAAGALRNAAEQAPGERPWSQRSAWLPVLGGVVAVVAARLIASRLFGQSAIETERLSQLEYLGSIGLTGYAQLTFEMLLTLSFMLFPLTLASLPWRRLGWIAAAVGVACAAYAATRWLVAPPGFDPLNTERATLTRYELGGARNLIHGALTPTPAGDLFSQLARALGYLSFGAAVVAVCVGIRDRAGSRVQPALHFFAALGLLHFALISVLWLYCDRYYLALLPALVVCSFAALRKLRLSSPAFAAALALQTTIGVVGTRDALRYNEQCSRSYAELLRAGTRPYDIDAGWSWNGWMLYAHAENLPAGLDRARDVPFVTSKTPRPYLLAKSPVRGYQTLKHLRWRGWLWPQPNELFVLRKLDAGLHTRSAPGRMSGK